eukprot:219159-Rhodomonas_salina.2
MEQQRNGDDEEAKDGELRADARFPGSCPPPTFNETPNPAITKTCDPRDSDIDTHMQHGNHTGHQHEYRPSEQNWNRRVGLGCGISDELLDPAVRRDSRAGRGGGMEREEENDDRAMNVMELAEGNKLWNQCEVQQRIELPFSPLDVARFGTTVTFVPCSTENSL